MNKSEFLNKYNDEQDLEKRVKLLAVYDFKELIVDENYTYQSDEYIENFLNYKHLGKYDCDKIFGEMFGYEYTDTMNSFWTIFKQYIKIVKANEFELENKEIKQKYIEEYKNQYGSDLTNQQLWTIHILKFIQERDIKFDEEIETFAFLTHSIGNFLEVPAGFNTNRYANTFDYWDITLLCIYKWCQTRSDFWLKILLNNNEEAINNTKNWILKYDTLELPNTVYSLFEIKNAGDELWIKFVGINHLQYFINKNCKPFEFFEGHFNNFEKLIMDNSKLSNYKEKEKLLNPQSEKDILSFFENIISPIHERGEGIIELELEENTTNSNINTQENEFDKLIVTDKTNIEFPIIADVMNWNEFYNRTSNDNGININDELFVDIDLLNEELYNMLVNSNVKLSIFRINRIAPHYIQQKILDWKV